MGEVYRARDTRLGRDVAIKVLPAAFTDDRDRLMRFEREAQILAQLHHTNIATVFGFEESTGVLALVMELVEGEDLSVRIAHGPIPLDEALPIAAQIAAALEAAHEYGIIHRDLKPANVKVRADGAVKVLDFGLAKALAPEGTSPSAVGSAALSPTLTARATRMGVIVGTAAYMPPEQARGKVVDRRVDIWAFGLVLFEMLTGQRVFAGEESTDVLAAVLRQEIDWNALPVDTPPRLRRLLERCLDRDAKRRLRDIGEARIVLDDLPHDASHGGSGRAARRSAVRRARADQAVSGCRGCRRHARSRRRHRPLRVANPRCRHAGFHRLLDRVRAFDLPTGSFRQRPLRSRRADGFTERGVERTAGDLPGAAAGR